MYISCHSISPNNVLLQQQQIQIKLRLALFVTYTII